MHPMSLNISQPTSAVVPCSGARESCGQAGQAERRKAPGNTQELSREEQQRVESLEQRDREVRAHEAAHLAASGGHARGGAHFSYKRGPDGKLYAVGGEVGIDVSAVSGDPEATIRKAQAIQRAALAPAEPSGQDRSVAAQAAAMAAQARQRLAREQSATLQGDVQPAEAGSLEHRLQAAGALGKHRGSTLHLIA
jgi:hypothetical protein